MKLQNELRKARFERYALLAANFYNYETVSAIIQAAAESKKKVILQVSQSTTKYLDIIVAVKMAKLLLNSNFIAGWLHLDHATSIGLIKQSLDAGFDSVMIDASEKSLSENIKITQEVVELAKKYNANVEAELGYVAKLGQDQSQFNLTDAKEAKLFCEETEINALAVAVGNAHGRYKGEPEINLQRLAEISDAINVPLVMHGSSGIPADVLKKSIQTGISKINLATEIKDCFIQSLRNELDEKQHNEIRDLFRPVIQSVKKLVIEKMELTN